MKALYELLKQTEGKALIFILILKYYLLWLPRTEPSFKRKSGWGWFDQKSLFKISKGQF